MNEYTFSDCEVRIGKVSGVIYVDSPRGYTILRICGLAELLKLKQLNKTTENLIELIDITYRRDEATYELD